MCVHTSTHPQESLFLYPGVHCPRAPMCTTPGNSNTFSLHLPHPGSGPRRFGPGPSCFCAPPTQRPAGAPSSSCLTGEERVVITRPGSPTHKRHSSRPLLGPDPHYCLPPILLPGWPVGPTIRWAGHCREDGGGGVRASRPHPHLCGDAAEGRGVASAGGPLWGFQEVSTPSSAALWGGAICEYAYRVLPA